jgi:hypothetical protein
MGSMIAAIQEHERRLAERSAIAAAQQAEREAHEASRQAMVLIHSTLAEQAVQEARRALCASLGNDPLAIGIHDLMAGRSEPWKGTASELLAAIDLPGLNAAHLGRRLRRIARLMLTVDIRVRTWRTHNRMVIAIWEKEQARQA